MSGALFIDESGDPGFRFPPPPAQGSSDLLVLAGVFFSKPSSVAAWNKAHSDWMGSRRGAEFKYEKATRSAASSYARAALGVRDWTWYAIACQKRKMWNQDYDPERLYRNLVRYITEPVVSKYGKGHSVLLDARNYRRGEREVLEQSLLHGHLEVRRPFHRLGAKYETDCFSSVNFADSRSSPGIQLADLIAGACGSANRPNRPNRQVVDLLNNRGHCRVWPR